MKLPGWSIRDITIETPSVSAGMHDLMGHGSVTIKNDQVQFRIRPRGLAGWIFPAERRSYDLKSVTGWDARGSRIEFTAGLIGMVATNGAEVPVHICSFTCEDEHASSALTDAAIQGGLDDSRVSRRSKALD